RYLDRAVEVFSERDGIFGIKLMFGQLRPFIELGPVRQLLSKCRCIWLLRRDVVAQAVSWYIALQTGEWTRRAEAADGSDRQRPGRGDVEYDYGQIRQCLDDILTDNAQWLEFFSVNEIDF